MADVDLIGEERTVRPGEHPLHVQLLDEMAGPEFGGRRRMVSCSPSSGPTCLNPPGCRSGRGDLAAELPLPAAAASARCCSGWYQAWGLGTEAPTWAEVEKEHRAAKGPVARAAAHRGAGSPPRRPRLRQRSRYTLINLAFLGRGDGPGVPSGLRNPRRLTVLALASEPVPAPGVSVLRRCPGRAAAQAEDSRLRSGRGRAVARLRQRRAEQRACGQLAAQRSSRHTGRTTGF